MPGTGKAFQYSIFRWFEAVRRMPSAGIDDDFEQPGGLRRPDSNF
jgi:hypothetical protein